MVPLNIKFNLYFQAHTSIAVYGGGLEWPHSAWALAGWVHQYTLLAIVLKGVIARHLIDPC